MTDASIVDSTNEIVERNFFFIFTPSTGLNCVCTEEGLTAFLTFLLCVLVEEDSL